MLNIFCIGLHNFRDRRDPGKFMLTYLYRNNAKNKAIYGPDFMSWKILYEEFFSRKEYLRTK